MLYICGCFFLVLSVNIDIIVEFLEQYPYHNMQLCLQVTRLVYSKFYYVLKSIYCTLSNEDACIEFQQHMIIASKVK